MVKALDPCGWGQEPLPLRMGPKIGWFESPLVHSHFGSYFSFLRHPLPVLYDFFLVLDCFLSFLCSLCFLPIPGMPGAFPRPLPVVCGVVPFTSLHGRDAMAVANTGSTRFKRSEWGDDTCSGPGVQNSEQESNFCGTPLPGQFLLINVPS